LLPPAGAAVFEQVERGGDGRALEAQEGGDVDVGVPSGQRLNNYPCAAVSATSTMSERIRSISKSFGV